MNSYLITWLCLVCCVPSYWWAQSSHSLVVCTQLCPWLTPWWPHACAHNTWFEANPLTTPLISPPITEGKTKIDIVELFIKTTLLPVLASGNLVAKSEFVAVVMYI